MSEAEALKQKGNERYLAKDFPEAIRYYSEAIAADPEKSIYYSNRAAVYLATNQLDEALADCVKATLLDQKNHKAYLRMGKAFYALGKYQRAIDEGFDVCLSLDPDARSKEDAEEMRTRALAALPKNEYGGKLFSYAHGKRHEWVEAEEDKKKRYGIGI